MSARLAMWGFLAASAVLHGIVSWLSPLQADDWGHLMWSATHAELSTGEWLAAFTRDHYVFGKLVGYVLAEASLVHVVLTPLVGVAVVWGAFVIATRRLPRFDDWRDLAGVVLIAAMIWIAAPRAGLVAFYRPYVATWLYSTALALWFLAPLRCGWRPRGIATALLVVAGLFAATATRQLGLALVVATAYGIHKTPRAARARWMWIALAAVVIGTIAGFADRSFDFRGYKPSFDRSLDALMMPIQEGGELIALVLGLVMLKLTIGALWPRLAGDAAPATGEPLGWLAAWIGYILFALLGPRYSEAALFPPAVMLAIAALPYLRWVMSSRPLRIATLVLAIGVHLVVWSYALATYVPLAAEYRDRIAKLERAPDGSVATIAPYRQIRPSFWAIGEDWADAAPRQLLAIRLFGLQDIEMKPAFRFMQPNPGIAHRLEVDGVTEAQLQAAHAPTHWATDVTAARAQFVALTRALDSVVDHDFKARLVVDLDFHGRTGRPVLAAWYEDGTLTSPRVTRSRPDDLNRQAIRLPGSLGEKLPEVYVVNEGRTVPSTIDRGRIWIQPMTADLFVTIICDRRRCLVADAFVPRF